MTESWTGHEQIYFIDTTFNFPLSLGAMELTRNYYYPFGFQTETTNDLDLQKDQMDCFEPKVIEDIRKTKNCLVFFIVFFVE